MTMWASPMHTPGASPHASDVTQPVAQQVVDQLAQWLVVGSGDSGAAALRTVNGHDLLASSSFAFTSPVPDGGLLSFWGRGAVTSFDGREGEVTLDGEVTTLMLGTDWSWGQWHGGEARRSTAGLLLSRSTGDGDYAGAEDAGEVDATLSGVFSWVGHRFTDRLEAWGAAGYGQGELQVTPRLDTGMDGAALTAELNLWLAAAGLRGTLLDGGSDGLTITGKSDAMVVGTSSGETRGMTAARARVTRLRLGVEAQRHIPLGNPASDSGAMLTPSLELGLRHDGGDAETGFGLDLGGGIVLSTRSAACRRNCGGGACSPTQRRVSVIAASPVPSPGSNSPTQSWVQHSPSARPWVGPPLAGRMHCSPTSPCRGWLTTTPAVTTTWRISGWNSSSAMGSSPLVTVLPSHRSWGWASTTAVAITFSVCALRPPALRTRWISPSRSSVGSPPPTTPRRSTRLNSG